MDKRSFSARRVKIHFDKHPWQTTIADADTGESLNDILRFDLVVDINSGIYEVRLLVDETSDDTHSNPRLEGEIVANVKEVVMLDDAVLDYLAHKVESRIRARNHLQLTERDINRLAEHVEKQFERKIKTQIGMRQ